MNQAILNIGLNVGDTEPTNQLRLSLQAIMDFDIITNVKVADGVGDWGNERTLVVALNNTMGKHYFEELLIVLCRILKQDAISYKTSSGQCGLVFNENYEGERFEFNPDYFITF
jgi:hypothetical protein